ncbi:MAG: ABC transporter ATP-binding protein [bacterium]|nr:ABC transporter ATP-binding protein [bacterium]MCX7917210.1 ABC transporter ATP-binding protein [bacterium]MDW8164340.1 ABC transporter ATP-binding protein [Candidatus Omnitrophota bacterium]
MDREILNVENIDKSFDGKEVLKDINFSVYENDFFFILGPSGCGKTTLLRIIAGFLEPDKGRIILNKKDITKVPPNKRNIGFVFQNYALWPHMKVIDNIAYGLKIRRYTEDFIRKRLEEILKITKLEEVKNLYPSQISGGQQQRVALARALIINPQVLLLDEPLSNLDAKLRDDLRREIRRIHRETGVTMVYVTHDQKEAMTLAKRIGIMGEKEIIQIGSPYEIYSNPKNLFVASFVGDINVLKGRIIEKRQDILKIETNEGFFFAKFKKQINSENVFLCFRPESITVSEKINIIKGKMQDYEFYGDTVKINLITEKGNLIKIGIYTEDYDKFRKEGNIVFSIREDKIIILEE